MDDSCKRFKIALIGGPSVGKTSMIYRYIRGFFTDDAVTTVHANSFSKTLRINNTNVILDIWDTAGQEKFRSIGPLFYRDAAACIGVYDVSNLETIQIACDYIGDYLDCCPVHNMVFIAGNKIDMLESYNDEMIFDLKEKTERDGYITYLTSAKTGESIEELFLHIATELVNRQDSAESTSKIKKSENKSGCC